MLNGIRQARRRGRMKADLAEEMKVKDESMAAGDGAEGRRTDGDVDGAAAAALEP